MQAKKDVNKGAGAMYLLVTQDDQKDSVNVNALHEGVAPDTSQHTVPDHTLMLSHNFRQSGKSMHIIFLRPSQMGCCQEGMLALASLRKLALSLLSSLFIDSVQQKLLKFGARLQRVLGGDH